MSSTSSKLFVYYNDKKKLIKFGPNTLVQDIIKLSCQEFNISDDKIPFYILKHKHQLMDTSSPFRYTGISNNASVDLIYDGGKTNNNGNSNSSNNSSSNMNSVNSNSNSSSSMKKNKKIKIAIQQTNCKRIENEFDNSMSLMDILFFFITQQQMDRNVLLYQPSIVYLRGIYREKDLSTTTLQQLGLNSGAALFKLLVSDNYVASSSTSTTTPSSSTTTASISETTTKIPIISDSGSGSGSGSGSVVVLPTPPSPPTHDDDNDKGEKEEQEKGVPESKGGEEKGRGGDNTMDMDIDDTDNKNNNNNNNNNQITASSSSMNNAIDCLRNNNFDADVKECISILVKYLDNIISQPGNEKTRMIKYSNATFQNKIVSIKGGIQVLYCMGFEMQQKGLDYEIARDEYGTKFLILSKENENRDLLLETRYRLEREAKDLQLELKPIPNPQQQGQGQGQQQLKKPKIPFDPYKTYSTSLTPTLIGKNQTGESLTEKKVNELRAKQLKLMGDKIPERNIVVMKPGQKKGVTASSSSASNGAERLPNYQQFNEETSSDSNILAKSLARKMAQAKKDEQIPFRTQAMRELENLQNAIVFSTTIMKIQFPDRTILEASFHPREKIQDVHDLIVSVMKKEMISQLPDFHLYITPPKTILQSNLVLEDEGFVPAAVIYLSFVNPLPINTNIIDYIHEDILKKSNEILEGYNNNIILPEAKSLVEDNNQKKSTGVNNDDNNNSKDTDDSERSTKKPKSSKPSWLKI